MYTGREWDSVIQQYHYRARMYDASLGRFCSRDPIGYTDGYLLYRQKTVLSLMDPSGNFAIDPIDDWGTANDPCVKGQFKTGSKEYSYKGSGITILANEVQLGNCGNFLVRLQC
jgi:RHS repeat-associated protein